MNNEWDGLVTAGPPITPDEIERRKKDRLIRRKQILEFLEDEELKRIAKTLCKNMGYRLDRKDWIYEDDGCDVTYEVMATCHAIRKS